MKLSELVGRFSADKTTLWNTLPEALQERLSQVAVSVYDVFVGDASRLAKNVWDTVVECTPYLGQLDAIFEPVSDYLDDLPDKAQKELATYIIGQAISVWPWEERLLPAALGEKKLPKELPENYWLSFADKVGRYAYTWTVDYLQAKSQRRYAWGAFIGAIGAVVGFSLLSAALARAVS